MRDAVLVSAVRTPVGKAPRGSLRSTRPDDLRAVALRGALDRVPALDVEEVEDVIIGCAMPEAQQGQNVARIVSLRAKLRGHDHQPLWRFRTAIHCARRGSDPDRQFGSDSIIQGYVLESALFRAQKSGKPLMADLVQYYAAGIRPQIAFSAKRILNNAGDMTDLGEHTRVLEHLTRRAPVGFHPYRRPYRAGDD